MSIYGPQFKYEFTREDIRYIPLNKWNVKEVIEDYTGEFCSRVEWEATEIPNHYAVLAWLQGIIAPMKILVRWARPYHTDHGPWDHGLPR